MPIARRMMLGEDDAEEDKDVQAEQGSGGDAIALVCGWHREATSTRSTPVSAKKGRGSSIGEMKPCQHKLRRFSPCTIPPGEDRPPELVGGASGWWWWRR